MRWLASLLLVLFALASVATTVHAAGPQVAAEVEIPGETADSEEEADAQTDQSPASAAPPRSGAAADAYGLRDAEPPASPPPER